MHCRFAVILLLFLAGCAPFMQQPREHQSVQAPLAALMPDPRAPAPLLLVGEQHDAREHQRIEREVVDTLAARGVLAALAIEMADAGKSTATLSRGADESTVQAALGWNDTAWPWRTYGPVVMAAVRAGVPVLGANLPRERMRAAMADTALDARLPPAMLEAQRVAIRDGHCGLLPESQIAPMTRIQIARDVQMAQALQGARLAGKTAVLVAGSGHVLRDRGVPVHLGGDAAAARVLVLQAGAGAEAAADHVLRTPALPPTDYCASLRERMAPRR